MLTRYVALDYSLTMKRCKYCKKELKRKFGEDPSVFEKRKMCNKECSIYFNAQSTGKRGMDGATQSPKVTIKHCVICKQEFKLIGSTQRSHDKKTCGDKKCIGEEISKSNAKYKDQRNLQMDQYEANMDRRFKFIKDIALANFKNSSLIAISKLPDKF